MAFPAFGVIETPRLSVRPIDAGDLADLHAVNGDPAVTRFLPYATWTCEDDAQSWFKRMQALTEAATGQQFVIELKTSRTVIGTILLFKHEPTSARAELGYALGRQHWRQGLMAEALRAFCTHAFRHAGLRRLEAEVNPTNAPSNELLQRLGFVREGLLRQRWVAKGVTYDTHFYGVLADEWLSGPHVATPRSAAQLRFRRATADDVPACLILRGKTRENAISAERLASMGITVQSWADDVRRDSLPGYVCTDDAAIAGYCFGDKATGEVVVLALLPAYENQGVGRHLLGLVVTHLSALGHRRLYLGCSADSSTRSHGFYRHLGWVSTGTFDRAGDEVLEFFPSASAGDALTEHGGA